MEWVVGIAATVLAGLLVWCIKAVHGLTKDVGAVEGRIVETVSAMVAKEKDESILAHRRIGVLDQTLGDLTENKFNSRSVAEGTATLPKIHRAIQRLLHGANS